MPPEPLPFDRKDFLKDRKPSSLDPLGIVQPRWREPPTTPSQHNNRGSSSSCRWGSGGGPSDFRRPFSGFHGKLVGGGWHNTTVESGSKENSCITNSVSMPFGSQKDPKAGVNSWKTTASASPNGNSLLHNDQLQSVDQHAKNSGGGFSTTSSQRLEKENSLGSSLDWKPVKWIRSGSLSSRGSGFSHSGGCKIIGVDPLNTSSPLRSPSEDASQCVTPNTPDEANSRKKQRLGWGEGLAKYEKKKVDPDDIVDKEAGVRNGMVDGVSGSEPLLTSPYNMSDKSPSVNGYSECASPTTPYSFACSSSTGLEEKESTKKVTVDTSVASCHLSENHTEQLSSNLENLEHNLSFSIDELLQTDDSRSPGSGFVKSTAMEKLQVWKAELTRTLEITETEIDSLENELKSLVSDGGSCAPPASNSFLTVTASNHKTSEETCGPLPVEKTDSSPEGLNGVDDDSDGKSPGTTSKFVEPHANCSEDVGNDDMLGFVASCGDGNEVPTGSSSTDSDGEDVDNGREDNKLYGLIVATNKAIANRASDELSRLLLPTTHLCTNISKATDESSNKIKFASRKRFLKFKERVITSKFRALQYSWKEELHSLSLKKIGAKSQKKFESSSRMGYADHQKCRSPGGSLTLVPTTDTLDYVKKLLSDSRVKAHKKALKMPSLILDRSERMMTRFISDNGLVENPVDIEKERSIVNPWTEKETEIFLEKYSLFGKDFKKIASFLESRTIGDCVEFYYKNHKSDCFQNAKKNSKFAKGKSCSTITTNTYLVTSGRRMNSEGGGGAGATSLEMLGAASAMVANVDSQQKNYYVGTSNDPRLLPSEGLSDFAMSCNEQETAAADVLAGICGSISSEALGSCITSSVDHGDVHHHHHGRRSLKLDGDDVDEDTCSDDSCDEDMDASYWTDEEKSRFIKAFRSHGKDFSKISRSMRTKTSDQCRVFFSKARKCLGLDVNDAEGGSEGNNESDDEDAFMVENDGSDISHGKSSLECSKMDDLVENNMNADVGERRSSNGCDSSASCPKVEGKVSRELTTCPVEDLNKATLDLDSRFDDDDDDGNGGGLKSSGSEKAVADNGFLMMSNFFPGDSSGGVVEDKDRKKTLSPCSQDDVSSRLSFRKSCDNKMYERCSNLPKHSLLDCAESSQVLRGGYPVIENKVKLDKSLLITSVDVEKEKVKSRSGGGGGVKLFGQILTKRPQEESSVVVNDKKAASSSLDVDHSNNSVTIRSPHGYWDGKKVQMQMGVPAIPDSERLLAKYPAAFSKTSAFLSFDRNHQFRSSTSLRMVSGFEACSSSGAEGFTVDKLLLPRKGGGMSDPVAAIRRHYANRGEEYKSGSGDI